MKTFQLLIVLLLLCLSPFAQAGDKGRGQTLATPALWGEYFEVTVVNNSGHDVNVHGDLMNADGSQTGQFDIIGLPMFGADGYRWVDSPMAYVRVSWVGKPDDVIVTLCSETAAGESRACVNAN